MDEIKQYIITDPLLATLPQVPRKFNGQIIAASDWNGVNDMFQIAHNDIVEYLSTFDGSNVTIGDETLEAYLASLDTRVVTLEGIGLDHEARLVVLESTDNETELRLVLVENAVADHEVRLAALEPVVADHETRLQAEETISADHEDRIDILEDFTGNPGNYFEKNTDTAFDVSYTNSNSQVTSDVGTQLDTDAIWISNNSTRSFANEIEIGKQEARLDQIEKFALGANAFAEVGNSTSQDLAKDIAVTAEFDTIEIGDVSHIDLATNRVGIPAGLSTVNMSRIRINTKVKYFGQTDGDITVTQYLQHLDSNGIEKALYTFPKTVNYSSIDQEIIDYLVIDTMTGVVRFKVGPQVDLQADVLDTDMFAIQFETPSVVGTFPVATVQLEDFSVIDYTSVVAAGTASEISFDSSSVNTTSANLQDSTEELFNKTNYLLDTSALTGTVTEVELYDLCQLNGFVDDNTARGVELTVPFLGDLEGIQYDGVLKLIIEGVSNNVYTAKGFTEDVANPQTPVIITWTNSTDAITPELDRLRTATPFAGIDTANKNYVDDGLNAATTALQQYVDTQDADILVKANEYTDAVANQLDASSLGDTILQSQLFQLCVDQGYTTTELARGVHLSLPYIGILNNNDPSVVINGTLELTVEGIQSTPFGNQYIAKGFTEDISNPQYSVLVSWMDTPSLIQPSIDFLRVRDAVNDYDAANKQYVDAAVAANTPPVICVAPNNDYTINDAAVFSDIDSNVNRTDTFTRDTNRRVIGFKCVFFIDNDIVTRPRGSVGTVWCNENGSIIDSVSNIGSYVSFNATYSTGTRTVHGRIYYTAGSNTLGIEIEYTEGQDNENSIMCLPIYG